MNQAELRGYRERLIHGMKRGNQELLRVRLESLISVFPLQ